MLNLGSDSDFELRVTVCVWRLVGHGLRSDERAAGARGSAQERATARLGGACAPFRDRSDCIVNGQKDWNIFELLEIFILKFLIFRLPKNRPPLDRDNFGLPRGNPSATGKNRVRSRKVAAIGRQAELNDPPML